ncbi:hypothetical protein Q8F55_003125 [Vanrija albida]|uniref:Carrier domain-containing protein n=1 Tax=Vanrija albida TaxID=181172 RepID=A0ABR3QBN6_9TREE
MAAPHFHAQSLTELIALRAKTQPDDPAVHTGIPEDASQLQTLTYGDIQRAVDRLAAYYAPLAPPAVEGQTPPEQVVAVLVSTAVDESLLEIALAKLGLAPLLLSVNNSVSAIAHLCKITRATHLIYGPKFIETAHEAQRLLAQEGVRVDITEDKRFPLWGKGGVRDAAIEPFPARLPPEVESKRTCVILHSSGSTGFPKPVYITHYGMIANAANSVPKTGFSALPLFHGFGHFSIFRCIYHGKAFTLLPPHLPITADNIVRTIAMSPTPPVQHFAVPYVLKLLSESEAGTRSLASMETVSYAGAAVPDDLGDRLVAAGVPLMSVFGTTETGALMSSKRDYATDKAWNWVRAEGLVAKYIELVPHGNDTFEIVVLDGWPAKIVSNRKDGAYATKDLFQQHPDHPSWFKYIGRLDDTLTHTLGEKTNPVPLELAIRGNSRLIQECIVFGDGRPHTGCLILPSDEGAPLAAESARKFLDAIWPVIEEANSHAPTHSRILKDMVALLKYGTEIPVATKMSILRPACYAKFAKHIDYVYETFEKGASNKTKRKVTYTSQREIEQFLIERAGRYQPSTRRRLSPITEASDLHEMGITSLQGAQLRNEILKEYDLEGVTLGTNIIYELPTIKQLAAHIVALATGQARQLDDEETPEAAEAANKMMLAMVEYWSTMIKKPKAYVAPKKGQAPGSTTRERTIILTGASGALGCHMFLQLSKRYPSHRIVCFMRAVNELAGEKELERSLHQRGRRSDDIRQADCPVVNYAKPDFGLSKSDLEYYAESCDLIVHCAWPVNFSMSLPSYEQQFATLVNLINLHTLGNRDEPPPAFVYVSSISTVARLPADEVVPADFSASPDTAAPMGYGRSKWAAENIVRAAGKVLPAAVMRVGQLTGDVVHGFWNVSEAWPLLWRSAETLRALPELDEQPQWLPVDEAADMIAEISADYQQRQGGKAAARVFNIVNPHAGAWSDVLDGLEATGVPFLRVSPERWLAILAESETDLEKNPTRKLLKYYQRRFGPGTEPRKPVRYDFTGVDTTRVWERVKPIDAGHAELMYQNFMFHKWDQGSDPNATGGDWRQWRYQ